MVGQKLIKLIRVIAVVFYSLFSFTLVAIYFLGDYDIFLSGKIMQFTLLFSILAFASFIILHFLEDGVPEDVKLAGMATGVIFITYLALVLLV